MGVFSVPVKSTMRAMPSQKGLRRLCVTNILRLAFATICSLLYQDHDLPTPIPNDISVPPIAPDCNLGSRLFRCLGVEYGLHGRPVFRRKAHVGESNYSRFSYAACILVLIGIVVLRG